MKFTTLSRTALLLTIALGLVISAEANSLVIDELSSTDLTYSLNGGPTQTVTATSPDNWTINIGNAAIVTGLGGTQYIFVDWEAPGYATTGDVNQVSFYQYGPPANGSTVAVISCIQPNPAYTYPLLANGATYTFNYADQYTATFTDSGECMMPDGGATIGLLGLGLSGIVWLRNRFVRK